MLLGLDLNDWVKQKRVSGVWLNEWPPIPLAYTNTSFDIYLSCTFVLRVSPPRIPLCLQIRAKQNSQRAGLPSSFHVSLSVGLVQTCPRFKPIRLYFPATGGQWAAGHGRGLVKGVDLRALLHVWCREAWFTGESKFPDIPKTWSLYLV